MRPMVLMLAAAAFAFSPPAEARKTKSQAQASCGGVAGKITCEQWCKKYNDSYGCMTGRYRSCETMGRGFCVDDKPN